MADQIISLIEASQALTPERKAIYRMLVPYLPDAALAQLTAILQRETAGRDEIVRSFEESLFALNARFVSELDQTVTREVKAEIADEETDERAGAEALLHKLDDL